MLLALMVVTSSLGSISAGPVRPPAMGWNTWNAYGGGITEAMVVKNIDLLVSRGLAAAGYDTFVIDGARS